MQLAALLGQERGEDWHPHEAGDLARDADLLGEVQHAAQRVLSTHADVVPRLIQRWLRDQVMPPTRIDAGIANSVDTAVGYAGMALALPIAVSYAGFDVTNLAIVAGALSVGIGFGLQSIVNNFVSGLILLVERPIKVGDWISLGPGQPSGRGTEIRWRFTAIETRSWETVIVPNSVLMKSQVTVQGRVHGYDLRREVGQAVMAGCEQCHRLDVG